MNPLSSIGTGELILILVIALIFLGPERLPEIARNVGKTFRQFRDALQGMSSEFGEELASMQKVTRDIQEGIQAVQEVRHLPQTLVSKAATPLVAAVDEAKEAVEAASESATAQVEAAKAAIGMIPQSKKAQAEEAKEAIAADLAPSEAQPEEVAGDTEEGPVPAAATVRSSVQDEEKKAAESASVPASEQDGAPASDERRVVVEDDQT